MNFGLVFFQFLPLLLYILFDRWKGFRAGIIAAIAGAVLLVVVNYVKLGEVDAFSIGESSLIVIMGAVSLQMRDERLFKFQPTVLAGISILVLLYFEVQGTPLLVRYIPQFEKYIDAGSSPEMQSLVAQMHTAQYENLMAKLSRGLIVLLAIHGSIMAYAALYMSSAKWFFWRMMIYPGLLLLVVFVGLSSSFSR